MKIQSRNLFAAIGVNRTMTVLVVALFLALVATVASVIMVQRDESRDQQYLQTTAELRALSYRVTALSRESTSGNEEAFVELQSVLSSMDAAWKKLRSSDSSMRTALAEEIGGYTGVWQRVSTAANTIITNKDTIIFLNDVATTLNESLPELQAEHNYIVEILLENNAPADQVAVAQMQSWRAERIGRNIDKMLRGGGDADKAADQFNLDANLFGKVLQGMKGGDAAMSISRVTDADAVESLTEIGDLFEFVSSSVREIFEASPALFKARKAADELLDDGPVLLEALSALSDGIDQLSEERQPNNMTSLILGGVVVLCLLLLAYQIYSGTSRRLDETAQTNERNQSAILRLLDELADLADGDLTTTATVTEDFTGAIADSVNYTIDQLRVLVSRINETAVNVSSAAQDTQQTALHLAEASEHQAQEIAGASAAVNEMAVTIDQVSANAAESAAVAERSVSIANNGSKVVQNTIHGMDTIREQIQDTSKRIKRLGESSQEIGDIVSLINDIADQTNILALNAAIQASMAGDAGRGFAVVADEVQRLAERSAAATKQIEALVKTIQNDTNEAVISMEQTTSEVVRGARLAQDAGVALEEIEGVSASLADLIQNISNAARQQASSAGHISNTMNVIQEITSQTSSGTAATAESIGNLADMAQDLRQSVAGFTLPEEASNDSSVMPKAPLMDEAGGFAADNSFGSNAESGEFDAEELALSDSMSMDLSEGADDTENFDLPEDFLDSEEYDEKKSTV
ncbi:chemotaxis protein [Aestuariicella hydrocarbonica]|uniref:Chemotaxis protein n=1 Tax=Pseudomaricurvus hydrocarbonicus TaxID=1470433 RepID=A0A9E5MNN8_9GAMM|nr:chemotaxis protein [Aestuariicella hydrocarbonica]